MGVVVMKEDESLGESCKVCYYNGSGLECGLHSRSGVKAAVMTHCVGEESQVVHGKAYPQTFKAASVMYCIFHFWAYICLSVYF